MSKQPTVQDIMIQEMLEFDDEVNTSNETLELLDFFKHNSVPLTETQTMALFQLQENGLDDVANYIFNIRSHMAKPSFFYKLVDKLTLANRIKGNAKLKDILKANANPANGLSQYQMQGMNKKEIGG